MSVDLVITGGKLCVPGKVIDNPSLGVTGERISAIENTISSAKQQLCIPEDHWIIPGMIDCHIHGMQGVDVMDATETALTTLCRSLPKQGTTAFLATTMTMSIAAIEKAIATVASFVQQGKDKQGASILGIHLEGPFISPEKAGAHTIAHIQSLDCDLIRRWQALSGGLIKMVTFAPELPNVHAFIETLLALNIIPAIGHTNATAQTTQQAIDGGCCHATHLYNAMSGLHHRHPGAAAAILANPILAEIIADGHHVSPEMIAYTLRIKGADHLCLVTDAMRAQCMPEGKYDLGGQQVSVLQGRATLDSGVLAGSVLTMQAALKNVREFTHCDVLDLIKLSSENVAKQLQCFSDMGSLEVGKLANIVIVNQQFEVTHGLVQGKLIEM